MAKQENIARKTNFRLLANNVCSFSSGIWDPKATETGHDFVLFSPNNCFFSESNFVQRKNSFIPNGDAHPFKCPPLQPVKTRRTIKNCHFKSRIIRHRHNSVVRYLYNYLHLINQDKELYTESRLFCETGVSFLILQH